MDRLMDPDDPLNMWMDPEEFLATIKDCKAREFLKSRIELIFGMDQRKYQV